MQQSVFLYIFFLVLIGLSASHCTDPEIDEGYKPDHKIEFSHEIHVSKGIDCKYCHNSANDGKTDGIPTANLCMKCHKQITGDSL